MQILPRKKPRVQQIRNVQLTNTIESKDILCQRLIERENVWIQKLETLHPKGLNQELGS